MASRVLSIEIDPIVTKICEMDGKARNSKVYKSFIVNTPDGVISDGMLQPKVEYLEMLREAIAANKVKTKKVIFAISSSRIASREVVIPYVKENRVDAVIRAKAAEFFPVDISNYKVSYTLLGVIEDERGRKRHKALVLAVPVNLLEGYYDLAKRCGLEIESLDYVGNSLFQAVKNNCTEGTQMVAKIDDNATMMIILQDGEMVSIRQVPYGVSDAVHAAMEEGEKAGGEEESTRYRHAVDKLREKTYIREKEEDGREVAPIVREVTEALDYLVGSISRTIDFYNSKSSGASVEKIYLTGVGGSLKGMHDFMSKRLSMPVVTIKSIENLTVPRDFYDRGLGDYIACIGAAIQPLKLILEDRNEKRHGITGDGDNSGLAAIIGAGGIIIAFALALSALIPYKAAERENQRLLNRIEELKPAEVVYNTYIAAQNLWTDATNMYEMTENHNDNLVAFIRELEQKMPSDIAVLSMVASVDNVTLNINVDTKESAAKVLQELREFESISILQTSELTDMRESEDVHMVSFSVNCSYVPMGRTTETVADTSTDASVDAEQQ